jgi:hypothetical protein
MIVLADFDRIRAEQTRTLYRLTPLGVSSAGGIALLVAIAGHGRDLSDVRAIGWSLCICLCALVHIALCEGYRRAAPPDADWRRWMAWSTLMALIEGMGWGFGAVLLTSADDSTQALVVLVAWAGVCSGGALVFGAYLPTYLAFLYPTMLPHLLLTLRYRYPHFELLAGLEIVFLTLMPLIALQLSRQLVGGMRLRFANLDLAEDLQAQKVVAEQANLAKSQFLAAASHDLRQPVHALGLFVGALRGRRMDAESRRLLDQIDMSVAALDELFSACSTFPSSTPAPCSRALKPSPSTTRWSASAATTAARRGPRASPCATMRARPAWTATRCC